MLVISNVVMLLLTKYFAKKKKKTKTKVSHILLCMSAVTSVLFFGFKAVFLNHFHILGVNVIY